MTEPGNPAGPGKPTNPGSPVIYRMLIINFSTFKNYFQLP